MSVRITRDPEGFALSARFRLPAEAIEALSAIVGAFLLSRLALLALAARLPVVGQSSGLERLAFDGWSGYDSLGYLAIARNGYWFDPMTGQGTPALLPIYPLLVRALGVVGLGPTLAALLVSNVALVLALAGLYQLVRTRLGRRDLALRSTLLFVLFPVSFVLSAANPLSLVMLCTVLALLAAEQRQSVVAAGCAILASFADPIGVVLWIALGIGWIARWARRKVGPEGHSASEAAALLLGMATTGGLYSWFRAELVAIGYPTISFGQLLLGASLRPATRSALWTPQFVSALHAQPGPLGLALVLGVGALMLLPRVNRTLGLSAAVYVAAVVVLALARAPLDGGVTLALAFPAVVPLAAKLSGRAAMPATLALSAALMVGLAAALARAAPPVPVPLVSPPRTLADTIRTTYHRAIARQPHYSPPRDQFLDVDDAFLILGDQAPAARYQPGGTIPLTYYLYALRSPEHGYLLSLRLSDLQGRPVSRADKVIWGNADASLTNPGALPALAPGNYLVDNVVLPLNPALPVGVYALEADVFAIPSYARLPLRPATGAPLDHISYPDVVIAGPADLGTAASLTPPHSFDAESDAGIALRGYDVQQSGSDLLVSLYWEARVKPDHDYSVFVQGLDSAGKVVAQSDGYPAEGRFPTTRLAPGQVIRDTHRLALSGDQTSAPIHLIVGLYRLETMRRATFARSGATSDHVDLGPVRPAASLNG